MKSVVNYRHLPPASLSVIVTLALASNPCSARAQESNFSAKGAEYHATLEPAQFRYEKPTPRILPLGDSLTAGGYNLNHNEWHVGGGYRENLWKYLTQKGFSPHYLGTFQDGPISLPERFHEGHSGWRTDQLKSIVGGVLQKFQPDFVLLMIGTNDVTQNTDLRAGIQNIKDMILEISRIAPQTEILLSNLITTSNSGFNKRIDWFNDELYNMVYALSESTYVLGEATAPINHLNWVDMFGESGLTTTSRDFTDGVHPTARGYDKMAKVWERHLSQLIAP